ncbi:MAG: hypothetical protein UX24_C0009G0013 [Candidatus Giovannonibacteria bacterium GW2011_GWB1_45_9b]|uniref:Uncharacterized protein n=2 Tax=Candidatus Giovannoniibacteriota TaxID=1752738 RepID=A0A0G1M9G4_9BACT|nr:MAG: hypothetical protein UX06_C0005G0009 [Candidatus Giovannonibacteria bacterium GW2011_GWA2_45_21]KKU16481.1 MAG: hypothetical protein UX24_C0009G0013 [Candidatus Giovannonibacteria bacterium GW2011_GWB1_45_9b]
MQFGPKSIDQNWQELIPWEVIYKKDTVFTVSV